VVDEKVVATTSLGFCLLYEKKGNLISKVKVSDKALHKETTYWKSRD
jgi:hypothetical protein